MKLANFSVNKPVTIMMIALIIIVLGGLSFTKLGLDLLPDIEYPTVSVVTAYNGVTSEDIENVLTKPIEDAVGTVKNVKTVSSISREGLSVVLIEFNWGTNVDFAAQDVRDKIGLIKKYLPEDADNPLVIKTDVGTMPILGYGVTSDNVDTLELKKILKDNIKDRIERIEGVASVEIQGGKEREILVKLNKPQLELYGLTQEKIISILRSENINLSGGFIEQNLTEFPLRTVGEYKNLEEIKNTIVAMKNGIPVYLKDVAEVIDGHKELRSYSRTNRKDSLLMMINKQSGANTVKVVGKVKNELPKLKQFLPPGTKFALVMDQSKIIKSSTNSVAQSGIIGGLLAILMVYLFLRNWRPTFAIAVAIPFSLIATFIPLYVAGYTLNLMTLGGLSLGMGMLVDNAVVVIENIYRHLEQGKERKKAAKIGANEVGMAITASTLTTIAVFLPMSLGNGIVGQLSRGMSLTVIFALTSSLFAALTLVPMIASKMFKKRETAEDYKKASGEKYFKKIQAFYKKVLIWALEHRKKTIFMATGLLTLTLGLIPFIGTEFMPTIDQSMMILQVKMPAGSSLTETNQMVSKIENIIFDKVGNNIVSLTSFVGQSEELNKGASMGLNGGINKATILMRLKDKENRKLSGAEIEEIIRKNKPPVRGLEINPMDMAGVMTGGVSSPIEIKIFGKNLDVLKKTADKIAEKITNVKGVRDVNTSLSQSRPELVVKVDREKSSRLGLTVGQIGLAVKNSMQGVVATQLRQGGEETDIRVRYDKSYRNSIEKIENLIITNPFGNQIPLKQIASVSQAGGPVEIDREDQLRKVTITADIFNRDVGGVVKDIKNKLANYKLPSGYFLEYGGSYKQMKNSFAVLAWALALGILLVYMVMASQFESLIDPFIVMFEIPLAFIGVGLALFVTKQTLSLPSFMGMIILAGIVVNNAIVLIDYVNQLRAKGMDKFNALVQGGTTRLRPILITSFTTILGMLPMALAQQEGSEMMRPMAIAVIGGLLVSTALTLVVIPVIYSAVESVSQRATVKISGVINKK